jgi:hypothetical protein
VWDYFDYTRPHVPQFNIGRVHYLNNHGSIVYLTVGEMDILYNIKRFTLLFAFAAIAIRGIEIIAVRFIENGKK